MASKFYEFKGVYFTSNKWKVESLKVDLTRVECSPGVTVPDSNLYRKIPLFPIKFSARKQLKLELGMSKPFKFRINFVQGWDLNPLGVEISPAPPHFFIKCN